MGIKFEGKRRRQVKTSVNIDLAKYPTVWKAYLMTQNTSFDSLEVDGPLLSY
jgi:hypothetical protein